MLSWWQAVLAAAVAWLATWVVGQWARARGWVDQPGARRVHQHPVPRLGGIGIFVGLLVGGMLSSGWPPTYGYVVAGACLLVAVGGVDDIKGLSPGKKLVVQVLAACLALAGGVRIEGYAPRWGGDWVSLGAWSWPLTILWIVGLINAINWIDGLDGLAGGISLLAAATLTLAARATGRGDAAQMMLLLGAATFGFLLHNFHPARIFMGDSGAMLLGYLLATVSVMGVMKTATLMALAIPVLALAVPIADALASVVRRLRHRQPIYQADRSHLHHRLLDAGWSHPGAVLVLYGVTGVLCTLSLLLAGLGQGAMLILGCTLLLLWVLSLYHSRMMPPAPPARPAAGRQGNP